MEGHVYAYLTVTEELRINATVKWTSKCIKSFDSLVLQYINILQHNNPCVEIIIKVPNIDWTFQKVKQRYYINWVHVTTEVTEITTLQLRNIH